MTDASNLITALSSGPRSASALCTRLGVSRPTLSRAVAAAGARVIRYGKARATAYALRRTVAGQTRFPIHRVEADARVSAVGWLEPVAPSGYLVNFTEYGEAEHFEGLPWWLQDMRPQGFLGRAFARREAASLHLPADLREWGDDEVLAALATVGDDGVGNLLVGDAALARYLGKPQTEVVRGDERANRYPALAAAALAGELPGSSAGGEQPKFAAIVEEAGQRKPVLVKFSSAADNPVARRWASLLVAEHLALQTLAKFGLPASRSSLHHFGGQTFLEVERFDRMPATNAQHPHLGRCGVVSLAALDAAFVGQAHRPWPVITAALAAQGRITPAAQQDAERLWAFGRLIGNTDMHAGNLAFLHAGSATLELAPAYDMLPMALAPRASGEVPATLLAPLIVTPPALDAWRVALLAASAFWESVATDTRIDELVRNAAHAALAGLEALKLPLA
ncbi:type II toxin-antitoxin system HipA family toxin YjjJ [Niveibacterium sp. 24ML]|uniref:type II toxin-antitoxin system HipA family toxin YjjJ n=1 Tax=Niveibacterium sp. 24ML TaxID=2985512 RepID=UPI00226D9D65|nr:type II toxin-antitoxin system HipA family toxin YjjJ [Niveibacterium sp. 24ML]MCX9155776.1 type II toxin-antitoxin system HipA family toxin YjjJ [Niveibacterium sp. 24ML]